MPTLQESWRHVLSLSALAEGENVIVLGSPAIREQYKTISLQVVSEMGGAATYLEVANPNRLPTSALPSLRDADLIIDLSHGHDPGLRQFGADGPRTVVIVEPPEILQRMLPEKADKARVLHAQSCIRGASSMRVTSAAGTDFQVELGELTGNSQYGFADERGHWDQWPGALGSILNNRFTIVGRNRCASRTSVAG